VATVDIPGVFMQADMDETVYMKITGTMVDMLVEIEPSKYTTYVILDNQENKSLFVKLNKALYGTFRAALLFWKKLSAQLQEWGYNINLYDQCVANKIIDGSQCTIIWHVDDLKVSHVNPDIVSSEISKLSTVFGKEAPLTVYCGKIHEYLGMTINFSDNGKVMIKMMDYIVKLLAECPEDMAGLANPPGGNHLFQINNQNPEYLSQDQVDLFHTLVAKLLFLCKRARPAIQTAVSFLCTWVTRPDVDD
jgi:Reverse transcriptase (RNA-dependent DNA polymerase)